MIRPAVIEDVSEIVALCKEFYDEMGYAKLGHSFDDATVARTWQAWIESNMAEGFIAEDEGRAIGVGGIVLALGVMNLMEHKAIETVWHTLPTLTAYKRAKYMMALFEAMEGWAKRQGARTIHFSTAVSKGEAVDDFLCRNGYALTERHYVKEL